MKNKTIYLLAALSLVVMIMMFFPNSIEAQCPMCRITAESNLKNGGTMGRGLNNGILYMFFTPYLIVGAIGIWWWRNRRVEEEEVENMEFEDEKELQG